MERVNPDSNVDSIGAWVFDILGDPKSTEKIPAGIEIELQEEDDLGERRIKRGLVECLMQTPGYTMTSMDMNRVHWEVWKYHEHEQLAEMFKLYIVNMTHNLGTHYTRQAGPRNRATVEAVDSLLPDPVFSKHHSLSDDLENTTRVQMKEVMNQVWAATSKGWLRKDAKRVAYMLSIPFDDVGLEHLTSKNVWVDTNRQDYVNYIGRRHYKQLVTLGVLAKGGHPPRDVTYSIDSLYLSVPAILLGGLKRAINSIAPNRLHNNLPAQSYQARQDS